MAGVEQNRYKTNNGCIKHLPQTGYIDDVCSSHPDPRPNSFVTGGGRVIICTICLVEYPKKDIQIGLAILYYFYFLL